MSAETAQKERRYRIDTDSMQRRIPQFFCTRLYLIDVPHETLFDENIGYNTLHVTYNGWQNKIARRSDISYNLVTTSQAATQDSLVF
jgi:hypothetical protein